MSAAAVLRSACRALRRQPTSSSRAFLETQLLRPSHWSPRAENIGARRLYNSDGTSKAEIMDKHPPLLNPHATTLYKSGHKNHVTPVKQLAMEKRLSLKIDKINRIFDIEEMAVMRLKEVMLEKMKRERRRKVFVRGCILIGTAIFVKKQFFGGSKEDKAKEIN